MSRQTLTCSNCGTRNSPGNLLCKDCGLELQPTFDPGDSSSHTPDQIEKLSPRRVRIATILAAGAFLIPVTYIATSKIRENAESRLAVERLVTCEWNKQHLMMGKFEKQRKRAADERAFVRFLYQGDSYRLDREMYDLQKKQERESDKEWDEFSKMCSQNSP